MCHKWRCIVLASSSQLQLRLFFAENTPARPAVLEPLSHLQVIVDYSNVIWNAGARTRWTSALRYPDRVYRIAVRGSRKDFDKICEALDFPFPALVSLELHEMRDYVEPILRVTSFMISIKSLRHLRLANVQLLSFLQFLSFTRVLVDLNLSVDTVFWQAGEASLLTHLQCMPQLHRLQVSCMRDYLPSFMIIKKPHYDCLDSGAVLFPLYRRLSSDGVARGRVYRTINTGTSHFSR